MQRCHAASSSSGQNSPAPWWLKYLPEDGSVASAAKLHGRFRKQVPIEKKNSSTMQRQVWKLVDQEQV